MEIKSIKTAAQINKEARYARICNLYKELSENFGQYAPTRRVKVIAEREKKLPDGITTPVGIMNVLRRFDLWHPRDYVYNNNGNTENFDDSIER